MNFAQFIELMKNDEAMVKQFNAFTDIDEAYAFAQEKGLTISKEEFAEELKKMVSLSTELSEEDLAAVSGGNTATDITAKILEGITNLTCV